MCSQITGQRLPTVSTFKCYHQPHYSANLVATGTVKDLASYFGERGQLWKTGDTTGLPSRADWPLTRAVGHPAQWGCFQWWQSTACHPVGKSRMSFASMCHHTRLDGVGTAAAGLWQLTQWHSLLSPLHEEPSTPETEAESQHQGHKEYGRLVKGPVPMTAAGSNSGLLSARYWFLVMEVIIHDTR